MRKQLTKTITELTQKDPNIITLLGDIGVFGFKDLFKTHPSQIINMGIMEQTMIGVAAGLSLDKKNPFVYTISSFLVERAYEQLKLDFGMQKLNGNFFGIGGSYDYNKLGYTHQCPADVSILMQIPNFEIVVPGHPLELDYLIKKYHNSGNPTYYRLTERSNESCNLVDGFSVIKKGTRGTVVAVGDMLDAVMNAVFDLDVTILYCNTIHPFDPEQFRKLANGMVLVFERYNKTLGDLIQCNYVEIVISLGTLIRQMPPVNFSHNELDYTYGLTEKHIRDWVDCLFRGGL